ncbi:MAG: 2,3-bisphosphoglycerate-independent phosphoglycerate mutase [Spirochaetaceae bacterium]|nr:2,3-bisphosphoglycerate-independent phosphoglycerate mutase [Spirochaetaceae bacterium]
MSLTLTKNNFKKRAGPVMLVIMDGVGYGKYNEGDAVAGALMNHLRQLAANNPHTQLKAHGTAVGLPSDDDMGNSEVGHNAIGAGRVFAQGAKLVGESIASGNMYKGEAWQKLVKQVKDNGSTLHFIGLLSDGGVHSNINHLKAMIAQAKAEGVKRVRIHALLDGRDVGETSALDYFDPFEDYLKSLNDSNFDAHIASGGGRMQITMDRYNAGWPMVQRGWQTHVLGEGRQFANAREAITLLREETGAIDQDIPPFVIAENNAPIGTIEDGDSVILFNFRGDRAIEISRAFTEENFTEFERGRFPKVLYAGMMQYDGDLHIPANFLVNPPSIDRTFPEYLCNMSVKQFSISETQKFGHVTYFFNGNRSGKFDNKLEVYTEVPSDKGNFDQRPAMQCAEITDKAIEAINSGSYQFIKLNFPNGDMVGHTGNYEAVVASLEAMDLCLGRLAEAIKKAGGIMVITADHGNADDMYEHKKDGSVLIENGKPKAKTSHSLNPVPLIIYDPAFAGDYDPKLNEGLGISSVAALCLNLLGFEAPQGYDKSVINVK